MEHAAGSKGITALRWISAFIMALAVLPAVSATAVTIPPNPPAPSFTTGMEIDGDKTPAGGFDWDQVLGATPPGPYSGVNFDSTGIVASTFEEDANGSGGICDGDDTSANPTSQFPDSNTSTVPPGGSNFNGWQIGPTTLQDKVDACTGAAALEIVDIDAAGHHQLHYVLYQYWTRHPAGTGSIVFFTVLEGPAAGRCDDYLIKFDFDPNGGSGTFTSQSWVPASGNCADPYGAGQWVDSGPAASTSVSFAGENVSAIDQGDPIGAQDSTFAESAVDLTSLGIIPSDRCVTFSASGFFTQTGNEGQLQDFVQYSEPLTLSNCNSLSVAKVSDPAGLISPSTFQYRIGESDNQPIHEASLIGPGDTDGSVNTITSDIAIGDVDVWQNVIGQTDYLVEELALPAGWTLATIECTYLDVLGSGDGIATPGQPGFKTATIYAGGASTGQDFDVFSPALAPAPECVITNETSGIQIIKDAVPNDAQHFGFTGDLGSFSLDDDPASSTLANSQLFTGLAAGTYAITETGVAGWDLTNLACDDPSGDTTMNSSTATVDLSSGEVVTCTFTNTKRASVTIVKDADPDDARDFGFTGGFGPFTLDDDPGDAALTNSITFDNVVPGTYQVTEGSATGWSLAGVSCNDPDGGSSGNTGTRTATLDVDPGEAITCTFTNTLNTAEITLTKVWGPGPLGDAVSLTADGSSGQFPAASGFDVNGGASSDAVLTVRGGETVTLSETFTSGTASNYTTTLDCGSGPIQLVGLAGTYTVPDEPVDATCTFTNTRKSSTLTLRKAWVNGAIGDSVDLSVTATNSGGSTSTAPDAPTPSNSTTVTVYAGEQVGLGEAFGPSNVGSYDTTLECNGQAIATSTSGTYPVPSTPTDVTCTFTNTRVTTTVVLQKHWIDAAQGDTADLHAAGSQGSPTATSTASGAGDELDTTDVVTLTALTGETIVLSEVLGIGNAGAYHIVLACDGGTLIYNGGPSGSLQVPKAADGTITCTFTNTAGRGTVIVRKDVAGADSTFDFTGTWAGGASFDVTTSGGTGQAVFSGVLVGTYSVSEVEPAGHDLMSVDCVDEDGGSTDVGFVGTLEVDAGETVLCTFTNAQLGPLDITKTVTSGPTLLSGTTYRITYDVVVTSQSFRAETFDLTDTIVFGAGVTVVSAQIAAPPTVTTVAGWTGSEGNSLLVDDGTIDPLGSITITVTVDAQVSGTTTSTSRDCELADGEFGTGFLNTATIAWENGTDTDDDCAIVPSADIGVVKTATPTEVVVTSGGEDPVVAWTMVVTNHGPNDAVGVVLDDMVPSGFTSIVVSTATGDCSINGQAVHCNLGALAVGESVTVTINATVTTESAGVYTNVVVVASASPIDPDLSNNTDDADVTVAVVAVLPPTLPPTTPSPTVPPPTAPPTPPPTMEQLPVTGGSTAGLQLWAVVALALGFLAIAASRRGRSRRARS